MVPTSIRSAVSKFDPKIQKSFYRDYNRRKKSVFMSYVAWIALGWHYLYLGRVGMQFAFWFTFGGFVVWWLVDCFRIPGMVFRANEDIARELASQYRTMLG